MRILFTGGGTGGHITPIVAVIRELKRIAERDQILDLEIFYTGPNDEFARELLKEEEVLILPILSGKFTDNLFHNILSIIKIFLGSLQALWNLFLIMPDVVFSKGGYGALPSVVAAVVFRLPLIIHESDSMPGRVNLFASRFAVRVGIAFPEAAQYFPREKTALVGVPIRKRIFGGNRVESKHTLDIYSELPVVGVMGASQGSQNINNALLGVLKELTDEFEVVHQTGKKNLEAVEEEARVILEKGHEDRYHPFGFFNEEKLRDFFSSSDIVVSRSSATSIYEIAGWGKPSILIPLGIAAQDHQRKNAYVYAAGEAAVIIEEANLTPHILLAEIKKIIQNPERRKKMSEAAQRFARVDSAELIAREILKLGVH